MSVREMNAERVFRCAFRLQQVAEDVRTDAARTARCYPDDWRGDAGIAYQQRLDATADRVRRMSVAYDAAGAVLLPYARALLDAQDMLRRADGLLAEAAAADQRAAVEAAAQGVVRLAGPGVGDGLRAAAHRLQADAADLEHRAAVVCAARLGEEAQRAPAASNWQKADRFLGDVALTGVDTVAGLASLVGNSWHSLPGIGSKHSRHEARHELAASAIAAAEIWNIPIDIRNDLQDGRSGAAAGVVLSVVGPGKFGKLERGFIRDSRLAHREALREADRLAMLASVTEVRRQTAEQMGANGVSLINEEKRGGHTIYKHVATTRGYLLQRNREGFRRAGTFRDVATAERLVNAVLRDHADELVEAYKLTGKEKLVLLSHFDHSTGRVTVPGSSRTIPAFAVEVWVKLEQGEPYVYTAFPQL